MTAPTEPLTPVGWDDVTDEDFVEALLNCQEQLKQARDNAAELRAAVRRMAAADAELTVVGEAPRPDVDEWGAKWDEAQREYDAAMLNICQLAATEGEEA